MENHPHPWMDAGGKKRSLVSREQAKLYRDAAQINSWDVLTGQLLMARARAGTLDPEIVAALLIAFGLLP